MRVDEADIAYFVTKKIGKSIYGSVRLGIVLRRRHRRSSDHVEERQDTQVPDIEWESTDLQAAIKISEFAKIHAMRGRHLEDPIKEISAMQLLGNYHPHVLGAMDVLQDDNYLYTITRHLPGGELYGRIMEAFPQKRPPEQIDGNDQFGYDEGKARTWFKQLIQALDHYHKKGVCHRDICLENIMLDEKDRVVLVDPGLSLRVPHSDPCNPDCVTDVSAGTSRRLMLYQGQGGKLMYAAPEIIDKKPAVDAYATDLWAAGVVGFVMLVGLAPFKWAHSSDKRFAQISRGGLDQLVTALDIPLSPEAIDLLQGFFWKDPRERWNLAEVLMHPWVQGKKFKNVSFAPQLEKRFSLSRLGSKSRLTKSCNNNDASRCPPPTQMVVPTTAYYC